MISLRMDVSQQFEGRAITNRHKIKSDISTEKTWHSVKSIFLKLAKKSVKLYPFIKIPIVIFLGPLLESAVDFVDGIFSMGRTIHHYRSFSKHQEILENSDLDSALKAYAIDKIRMEKRILRTKLLETISEFGVSLATLASTVAVIMSLPSGPGVLVTIGVIASVAGITFLTIKLATSLYYRPHMVAQVVRLTTAQKGMQSANLWFRKKIMDWHKKKLLKKYDNDLSRSTDVELEKLCDRQTAVVIAQSKIKSLKEKMRVAAVRDFDLIMRRDQMATGLEGYIENFKVNDLDEGAKNSFIRMFKVSRIRLGEVDGETYARKKLKEWFAKEEIGICKRIVESERLYGNAVVA